MNAFLICLAVLAFLAVAFEEVIHINKAKTTLFFGTLAWIILFFGNSDPAHIEEVFSENIFDIASLWLFLLAAMTFVAYLNQHNLIGNMVYSILPRTMPLKALPYMIATFCYVLSSFCDNITTALVSFSLLHSLQLSREQNIKIGVISVFAINAGGAAMITGDVTTLMIFNADKVGVKDLFYMVPAGLFSSMLLATLMLRGFNGTITMPEQKIVNSRFDKYVGVILIATIIATLFINLFMFIPPLLVFLFGLSITFLLAGFMKSQGEILEYIRKIEFETLLFFLGILLIVGMLREIGVLEIIASIYQNTSPEVANYLMGLSSALIDNVPLTAAVLKTDLEMSLPEWLGMTYAVGVGGSLLAIGSAAGVLALSKVDGLTFMSYLRYAPHLLVSFTAGYILVVYSARTFF